MAKLMYCLQCEEMVAVEEPIEGHSVVEFVPDEGQSEVCGVKAALRLARPNTPTLIGICRMNRVRKNWYG